MQNITASIVPIAIDNNYTPLTDVSLYEFFLALRRNNPKGRIHLRCLPPKDANKEQREKYPPKTFSYQVSAFKDPDMWEYIKNTLQSEKNPRGAFFTVNGGGTTNEEINDFSAVFVEFDSGTFAEQHAKLDAFPIQTSIRIETKRSIHAYWGS